MSVLKQSEAYQWVGISIASISLIALSTITITSIVEIHAEQKKMNVLLTVLFYVSVCSAILNLIATILNDISCPTPCHRTLLLSR